MASITQNRQYRIESLQKEIINAKNDHARAHAAQTEINRLLGEASPPPPPVKGAQP